MKRQREDSHLLGNIQNLDNGGIGGEHVADDDGLLYAPPGSILRLAIPRSLVPDILALLVQTTYGHPGVARTTEIMHRICH